MANLKQRTINLFSLFAHAFASIAQRCLFLQIFNWYSEFEILDDLTYIEFALEESGRWAWPY